MISNLHKKGTLLAQTGAIRHLHIVCCEPVETYYGLAVLVVNISTVKENLVYEKTCILKKGEHPFIKQDSYVVYRQSVVWKVESIERRLRSGEIVFREDVTQDVLDKVLKGFLISKSVNRRTLNFIKTYKLQ